jgi:DNA-binding transcriptional ArsR family regulator
MTSSQLEAVVMHQGRLDVLCCILDGDPLALKQLSAETGNPLNAVGYWVKLLGQAGLVAKTLQADGGETLYEATLDDHPDWVREAVEEHRSARRARE